MSTAPAAMAAAPRASRAHRALGTARASSRPWRRARAVPPPGARGRPHLSCAAEREAGDASTSAPAGGLSIIDSTDDVFAEFCAAQVELVARALGRGARCMLYLRASGVDGENLQLTEVASYPPSGSAWETQGDATRSFETAGLRADAPDDAFGAAASSFADSLGSGPNGGDGPTNLSASRDGAGGRRSAAGDATSITLRGGGSADEGDGDGDGSRGMGRTRTYGVTAAEALLVKQRVFALPSANALVVPLSRDDQLLGLLVGEMPAGGGWKGNSARTRKERARGSAEATGIPEVEVLSATGEGGEDSAAKAEARAQDTAEKFGDRRKAALAAAARSVVAAWAMHRRADYATAAAIRSDERVEGFVTEAREPLTVLRTLGGMLSTHLKPESPSRDMAEAIVAQGDVLAELSSELESALYPRRVVDELAGAARGGARGAAEKALGGGAGGSRALPAPGPAPPRPQSTTATSEALASGASPSCDVTPLVAGLLASAEVMAKPAGVTMTATFPEGGGDETASRVTHAAARADPRDVRETLALVIDAALVAAPRGGGVDVVVSANGGAEGGVVVAVGVSAEEGDAGADASLPAGALAAAAAASVRPARGGFGDAVAASETARAAVSTKAKRRSPVESLEETQSLRIARSLVEGAGGIFHVLPSLPPAVGRVEMWWPAARDGPNAGSSAGHGDARVVEHEDDAVDVYSS